MFSVFAERFGLRTDLANKLAAGFGGGMGRLQEVCGAVTGMFMVAGLKHGKTRPDDSVAHELTYATVRELSDKFKAVHKTILCRELLGCDLRSPEGAQAFKEKGMSKNICAECVKTACRLVEEHLNSVEGKPGAA